MLTDWALDRNATKHGLRIAELAGCPLEPYSELLHCLRSIDPVVLRRAQGDYSVSSPIQNKYDYCAMNVILKLIIERRREKRRIRFWRFLSRHSGRRKRTLPNR